MSVLSLLVPAQAHAGFPAPKTQTAQEMLADHAPPIQSGSICGEYPGYTKRIVHCVRNIIVSTVSKMVTPFANYLSKFYGAAFTIAIAIMGIMIATGHRQATKDGIMLIIKMSVVAWVTANYDTFFPFMLDVMEDLLTIVSSYADQSPTELCPKTGDLPWDVWNRVDCGLETLIGGIISPASVASSLIGFIVAALISNAMGALIGGGCFYLIFTMLMALARCVYIFVTAYIAFAMMILISPLFIPMVVFGGPPRAMFEKWLKLTMGFMLQPIFLFAYMAMLLAAFDTVVFTGPHSIYHAIAGQAASDPKFKLGNWLLSNGVYGEMSIDSRGVNVDPGITYRGPEKDKNAPPSSSPAATVNKLNLSKADTGILDKIGKNDTPAEVWKSDIYDFLGVSEDNLRFIKIDVPVTAIDWQWLVWRSGRYNNSCLQQTTSALDSCMVQYYIRLILSVVMALVTVYIFVQLLDLIPFIAQGISGGALSMPAFGTKSKGGNLDLPKADNINKAKSMMIGK